MKAWKNNLINISSALQLQSLENESDWAYTPQKGLDAPTWRCRICGYVHRGEKPPEECPYCCFPGSAFKSTHRR